MLQNKLSFNQTAVSLEVIGLPDYSNNEKSDQISIISSWKLSIIDKPLIEGNFDHLSLIMTAFYSYTDYLINNQAGIYESKLIDIKAENSFTHIVLLKSSKPDVEPLTLKIGNSILSDIVNCFEQFNSSNKVRKVNINFSRTNQRKNYFDLTKKGKLFGVIMPPIISLFSLFIASSTLIYFYNMEEDKKNKALINTEIMRNSMKSIKTVL